MAVKYKLESDVNDYVKKYLETLGLKKRIDFNEESGMSDYMKSALKGSAKTNKKTNFGKPDFHIEKYNIPIVIEDKLGLSHHINETKTGLKMDEKSIKTFAVNGAVYYAQNMIASKKYDEVVAIGISGEDDDHIKISVYYVFSATIQPKFMRDFSSLDFVQNSDSFDAFYKDATVTEEERHKILIKTQQEIVKHAKKLNKLMNNHNIGVDQRVVYVSGMLLSMQDIIDKDNNIIDCGLTPEDLKGVQTEQKRDSVIIVNHLDDYLEQKKIATDKKNIMLNSFKMSISLDNARDIPTELDSAVSDIVNQDCSITKQIFVYLYKNVYTAINLTNGALDIMAEMYSTFLKYALSDGAQLGKVLTPPYITTLMARILDVNHESKVMDLATGSAAFLVASMDLMILDANRCYGKGTVKAEEEITKIKKERLLGIEIDAKMYTLAASNMILRGDGSTNIQKADTFKTPKKLYDNFKADTLLLNPPFSYTDSGLPFFEFGLDNMKKGGKAAVIIQDSVGAGKATTSTQSILKKHKMLASIKMPADLFEPNASVQTSIYIFEAGTPHNFQYDIVKFIDFSNDGYKRTERCIKEIDHPTERYQDIYLIYKLGFNAVKSPDFHPSLWDLKKVYFEDTITFDGKDWNFEQHKIINTSVDESHCIDVIGNHFAWALEKYISNMNIDFSFSKNTKEFKVEEVFDISKVASYNKENLTNGNEYDYITRTTTNRGICETTGFIDETGLTESGTFSLGLLQMVFYYREKPWYAGQFMRKITCKHQLDRYSAIYMECILNGLSEKLLSGLVRDVDKTFLNEKITLPVKDGKIDFDYMSRVVKKCENCMFDYLKNNFNNGD